jgi:hypothetical protein
MQIFLTLLILKLAFTAYSAKKYLSGPIAYFNDYWYNYPENMQNAKTINLIGGQFCGVSNYILVSTFPPDLITHFCNLDEDLLPFTIFFWANILTIPFEGLICDVDYHTEPNGFAWRKAVISLISYTHQKLFVLNEADKKPFLNLVFDFYHKKLRVKFKKSQKDLAKFYAIDRKFYRLMANLETKMHEFNPPADIHEALRLGHQNILCQRNKQEPKVEFFFLVRYFRATTSEYDVLTWLIRQHVNFIEIFLHFNIFLTIDPDVPIEIILIKSRLHTFYISLRRIIPIFILNSTTKKVEITMKEEEIYHLCPSLREINISDLTMLLNSFFQILSN